MTIGTTRRSLSSLGVFCSILQKSVRDFVAKQETVVNACVIVLAFLFFVASFVLL